MKDAAALFEATHGFDDVAEIESLLFTEAEIEALLA